jgi:hypothetical protein
MHRPVSIPTAKRTVEETLQLVLAQVSQASGYRIELLDPGFSEKETVEFGGATETAGDAVFDIGQKLGVLVSFRCLFDETDRTYYLRVTRLASHKAGATRAASPGARKPDLSGRQQSRRRSQPIFQQQLNGHSGFLVGDQRQPERFGYFAGLCALSLWEGVPPPNPSSRAPRGRAACCAQSLPG